MKVKNWITCIQDRGKWKNVVEKAITKGHSAQEAKQMTLSLFSPEFP
jgi:hypothetical protein